MIISVTLQLSTPSQMKEATSSPIAGSLQSHGSHARPSRQSLSHTNRQQCVRVSSTNHHKERQEAFLALKPSRDTDIFPDVYGTPEQLSNTPMIINKQGKVRSLDR